ncbi:hypothetical protein GCM10023116_32790 [Kistimonas scapharcae]|uniref:Uncharacterized protein n=1 Tax=Kistimonas scapharcae TaxID=1036133 RepID=A0ABP8V526_9GAMM
MATLAIGDGSQSTPFLIQTSEDFEAVWHDSGSYYYELTTDLDMDGRVLNTNGDGGNFHLNGKGHKVINMTCGAYWHFWGSGDIRNIEFYIVSGLTTGLHQTCYNGAVLQDVRIHWQHNGDVYLSRDWPQGQPVYQNVVLSGLATLKHIANQEGFDTSGCYVAMNRDPNNSDGVLVSDIYDSAEYVNLDPVLWNLTPGSVPSLIPQTGDYSRYTHVRGTTLVDGSPVPRAVRAVTMERHELIAQIDSESDGSFELVTSPYTDGILVYAFDEYGSLLKPDTAYGISDVTHPQTPNGYRYICIQAGTTDATLPTEPWPTAQLASGTAVFEAYKLRQPMLHGPVTPKRILG